MSDLAEARLEKMISEAYTKDSIESLPPEERQEKLRELETVLNAEFKGCTDLKGWQDRLYSLIEELNGLGFFLGRWDYTWGRNKITNRKLRRQGILLDTDLRGFA